MIKGINIIKWTLCSSSLEVLRHVDFGNTSVADEMLEFIGTMLTRKPQYSDNILLAMALQNMKVVESRSGIRS